MRVLVLQDHEFQLHRAQALSFPQTAGFGMEWRRKSRVPYYLLKVELAANEIAL